MKRYKKLWQKNVFFIFDIKIATIYNDAKIKDVKRYKNEIQRII